MSTWFLETYAAVVNRMTPTSELRVVYTTNVAQTVYVFLYELFRHPLTHTLIVTKGGRQIMVGA
jgi:hypothetical protein